MGSRAIVPEQPRAGEGKLKNGPAEGRNRRVFRDIGNLVIAPAVEPKPQNQVARPITRKYGAQLVDNAQVVEKKNGKAKEVKFKNESIIIISSDEEEEESHKVRRNSKKGGALVNKPGKTLTATLSARSKALCGLAKKPKDLIEDIDAPDVNNELAAVEYIDDIYHYYKLTEDDGRVQDYMGIQQEVNSRMRSILVDWLIEVHRKFELMPETLYLAVNIMDRFLAVKMIRRTELQLVGISSMLIASKYEEIWAPEVCDLIAISDNAYIREQVLRMEKTILGQLEWYLTVPTPYVFLVRYVKASIPADIEMEKMAFFFAELGLVNYTIIVHYFPSMLAASAVYAARCTLSRIPTWTETLKHHTGYSESQLIACSKQLVSIHSGLAENKLKSVYNKYANPERASVALFPPAKSLLPSA